MSNLFVGLNIGRSSLLANQAGLDVSGHNLANVQTDGYSRQRASMVQSLPIQTAQHVFGSGVTVDQIQRLQVGWVERQINRVQVQNGYDSSLSQGLDQLQSLLGEPSSDGLGAALTDFWNSWESLSVQPTDAGLRAQILEQANHLTSVYNQKIESFQDAEDRFDEAVGDALDEVNSLAGKIADLNISIAKSEGAGRSANDLRDQRDRLVGEITQKVSVDVETDGSFLNLKLSGGGPYLVNRNQSFQLTAGPDENGHLADFKVGSGPATIAGGEIGALVHLRDEVSPELRGDLATWMSTVVDRVNALHTSAYDRDGAPGRNLFVWGGTADRVSLSAGSGITGLTPDPGMEPGTHHLTVTAVDANLVPNAKGTAGGAITLAQDGGAYAGPGEVNRDYYVRVISPNADPASLDGLRVQLFQGDQPVGAAQDLAGTGPGAVTWTVDGVDFRATVNAGAGFQVGDRSDGLATTGEVSLDGGPPIAVNLTNQNNIAFLGGSGNGFLGGGSATVNFSTAPFGGASFTVYGSESTLSVNPVVAVDTDKIAAASSPDSVGDGEMARRMGDLATANIFEATGETASGYLGRFVQALGAKGRDAAVFEEASGSILQQLQAQREEVSGVNVDEEMIQLMQYQRGFEAAARFLTTVDGLLDTLINGVGR